MYINVRTNMHIFLHYKPLQPLCSWSGYGLDCSSWVRSTRSYY